MPSFGGNPGNQPGNPANPTGTIRTVIASVFGGPGDPSSGTTGYRGDNLYQHPDSFAELSTNPGAGLSALDFAALGGLPYMAAVTVTNPANGKSKTLYKRDVGAGGAGIGSIPRAIDLWYSAAADLGISGLAEVQVDIGGTTGGTAGLGGTGTTPNAASSTAPFQVGDPSNPSEDYMTAASRLAQSAYWYLFGDGETVYLADGTMLMRQTPAKVINLFASDVLSWSGAWDNTSFRFAAHHKRRGKIQRRSTLAKIQSPTEMTVDIVCNIDELRGGDVAYVFGSGPGDGLWLIGDTYRSPFLIYTELTLVPAIAPVDAVAGVGAAAPVNGPAASRAGAGTVMAALLSMAATINNADYPYVWGGGHAKAGTPDVGIPGGNGYDGHTIGFDCSGAVAAVLAAAGLVTAGSSVGSDQSLVAQLQSAGYLLPGVGTGNPACTIYDNPGVHIFAVLNGEAWGTADGAGNLPSTQRQGAGWIPHWGPGSFTPYHIPATVLGKKVA